MPLQPVVRRQAVSPSPRRGAGEQRPTCSPGREEPTPEQGLPPKMAAAPWESPCWSSLCLKDCSPWEGPTLEQFMKNCSPWEGLMLEKFMEDCLLWEGPHTGAGEE